MFLLAEWESRDLHARAFDATYAWSWYDAVRASTGFTAWRPREPELPPDLEAIAAECRPHYERLRRHRLIC